MIYIKNACICILVIPAQKKGMYGQFSTHVALHIKSQSMEIKIHSGLGSKNHITWRKFGVPFISIFSERFLFSGGTGDTCNPISRLNLGCRGVQP